MIRKLALCSTLLAAGCGFEKAEGRPWIHDVKLIGVKHVKARDLKGKLALEETSFLRIPKKYLDPFTIDTDRARIEAYYRAHGFFNARVTDAEVTRHSGDPQHPKSVNVKITVDEGPPTHITEVTIAGLEPLAQTDQPHAAEKIEKALHNHLRPGAVFDHAQYLEEKDAVEGRLKHLGFAWATVDGQVEVNRDTQRAAIHLQATLGPRAVLGHVHVRGTSRVDPKQIAIHAGLSEGERFNPDLIEDARAKIYNLGLFSSVRVEYEHLIGRPEVADVIVTVQESTFNELRLGGGFGIESQRTDVHASVVYTRHNWRGGLRTLRLRLEPAYVAIPAFWQIDRQGPALLAEAQLTQPDYPWQLSQLTFTVGYEVGIDYAYQFHGPRTQLGVTRAFWRNRIQLGMSYNFQFLDFFNTDPTILNDPAQSGRLFGYVDPYRIAWFQEDVALDLRDKPLDAHKGFYAAISLEEGGIYTGSAFTYEKVTPEMRGYIPLGKRLTAALRVQFGQIFSQNGDLGTPITRRYYLGGPNSHRGFSYNRLSQQIPSGLNGVPPIPIGGDQMFLWTVELRLNVVQIFKNWFSIAAFVDAGDVAPPPCASSDCKIRYPTTTIDLGDLHYATGGGIRYKTVIGTIRFDLGVRLNRLSPFEPNGVPNPDPGQRFAYSLSVGEAF